MTYKLKSIQRMQINSAILNLKMALQQTTSEGVVKHISEAQGLLRVVTVGEQAPKVGQDEELLIVPMPAKK